MTYVCLSLCLHVCKQPFSESALRISFNSCILLAHIRRKNVRPICGKNHIAQNGSFYLNLESTITIFFEILENGGTLIKKSDNSGYPKKTYWPQTGPFLPLISISKLVCFVLGINLNYCSDCIIMENCK